MFHQWPVQMGFSVFEGDRGTAETVTREPEISIRLLVIISFSCTTCLKIKIEQMSLMFAFLNALYFCSSVWIYAFVHKCSNDIIWLHRLLVKVSYRVITLFSTILIFLFCIQNWKSPLSVRWWWRFACIGGQENLFRCYIENPYNRWQTTFVYTEGDNDEKMLYLRLRSNTFIYGWQLINYISEFGIDRFRIPQIFYY